MNFRRWNYTLTRHTFTNARVSACLAMAHVLFTLQIFRQYFIHAVTIAVIAIERRVSALIKNCTFFDIGEFTLLQHIFLFWENRYANRSSTTSNRLNKRKR